MNFLINESLMTSEVTYPVSLISTDDDTISAPVSISAYFRYKEIKALKQIGSRNRA